MIIKTIPRDSRFIQAVARFTAPFNDPLFLGGYTFGVAANQSVLVLDNLQKNNVYLIDNYSFSATVPEGDYLQSINTVPTFQLLRGADNQVIFPKPLPLVNYIDAAQSVAYFVSQYKDDTLRASFNGQLKQVAGFVGLVSITCQVSLNIYEIIDSSWIKAYKDRAATKRQEEYI